MLYNSLRGKGEDTTSSRRYSSSRRKVLYRLFKRYGFRKDQGPYLAPISLVRRSYG
jgi:hypothetical protein